MKKSKIACCAVAAAMAITAPALYAQSGNLESIPNGPNGDNDSTASLRSYAQLISALESSVHTSQGAAKLLYAPWKSNTGRDVPYVVIGNGPTAVLIIAQQHGDEMETSDSAVNLVRSLASSSQQAAFARSKLTIVVMPRVNVDGFDGENPDGTPITALNGTTVPWRQNYDRHFTGPNNTLPDFYTRGRGYDINRYHGFRPNCPLDNPNFPPFTTVAGVSSCETVDLDTSATAPVYDFRLGNPVPEAKNVRWLADQYKPVVALDMHHQGDRLQDGHLVTASTLYPTAVGTANLLVSSGADPAARTRFDAGQTMAKRVVVLIALKLAQYPYALLSRYPGGNEPGISRNAYGLLGSGSVLLELRGGIGTKSGGYIQKIGFHASAEIVAELAKDPTLSAFDPNMADILVVPANGVSPSPGNEDEEASHGG
jgi:hypothetical protein